MTTAAIPSAFFTAPSQPPTQMSEFARTVYQAKYSMDGTETWAETAHRVASNVLPTIGADYRAVERLIRDRKFIPGGRYLYASGRDLHQVNNCLLNRADDSREGWADLMHKAGMALMTGAGIGIDYSDVRERGAIIKRTGGKASGPCELMEIINEIGRHVMQGGSRRSAIWAGLNWQHPDIMEFIHIKDWISEVRELKLKNFNFPAPLDMTNVSVILDDAFFTAYHNPQHTAHSTAQTVYWETIKRMTRTAEPGFSIDTGANAGETLRNAPVCADTMVLTRTGYQRVIDVVDQPVTVWTGKQWANDVVFKETNEDAPTVEIEITGGRKIRCDVSHPFLVERYHGAGAGRTLVRIDRVPAARLQVEDVLHVAMPTRIRQQELDVDSYSLGYLYGDGSFGQRGNAEVTFCTPESKACAVLVGQASGISSVTQVDRRGYTRAYFRVDHEEFDAREKAIFPSELFGESAANIVSFLAGLYDADGNYEPTQQRVRLSSIHEDFLRNVGRLLEQLGILAGVSKAGISTYGQAQGYQLVVMSDYTARFRDLIPTQRLQISDVRTPYRRSTLKVKAVRAAGRAPVYCADVKKPEHTFMAEGIIISNCTEVTSRDDSDICNLGSINLARIESIEELEEVVAEGTRFLLAGTVYSHVPYEKVNEVRSKNRRLGLGLMGMHEWLLARDRPYGPDAELAEWLAVYAKSTEIAHELADKHSLSRPVKTRAVAPTGTIGIVAETTTGIEPIFCSAYKRRYLADGKQWKYQMVVDPTARRLAQSGIDPDKIEDAYTLAYNVERRVGFQAWVQGYVDHAISSTINLPAPLDPDEAKSFGNMLLPYLPQLRGITVYPNGARGGQPLTPVSYREAEGQEGTVFEEQADMCDITKGGSCGA